MNGGRGNTPPPVNGGEFLLQLLQKPPHQTPTPQPPSGTLPNDLAVAAVGPTIPFSSPTIFPPSNGHDRTPYLHHQHHAPPLPWPHHQSPPLPFAPHIFFPQTPNPSPNPNPNFSSLPPMLPSQGFNQVQQHNHQLNFTSHERLGFLGTNPKPSSAQLNGQNLIFGTLNSENPNFGTLLNGNMKETLAQLGHVEGLYRKDSNLGSRNARGFNRLDVEFNNFTNVDRNLQPNMGGLKASEQERSSDKGGRSGWGTQGHGASNRAVVPPPGFTSNIRHQSDFADLEERLVGSLGLDDLSNEKNDKGKHHVRDKDYRSDKRGQWLLGQRARITKRQIECRFDIDKLNAPFLAIYESLIPAEEEKAKQKQLLTLLEKLVSKEWPDARLYVYGSCANSFGFSKSDIDICLAMKDMDINKSEVLLKLAEILQSDNLQNVQALTRARVPIVKLMDPNTGISCDICINNMLAVINTKLLRDYAKIDGRLRQLAFIVKHWAKSRGVNETYQGTLSSYAYVLMCIHFLQQRKPAILPCLQEMEATCSVNVDNVECAYFDQVEKLYGFGARNGESIAKLVWAFFSYWAYCHDYTDDVISVRTGNRLSKRAKDWTRRIGNDRHLICIEDPFETSHDLGRVVDKNSIRVLREEFERAAHIMQYDPNPCVKLFEPYVPS